MEEILRASDDLMRLGKILYAPGYPTFRPGALLAPICWPKCAAGR